MNYDKHNIYPVAVWWQGLDNMEMWVKTRGVNVLWWDKQIHGMAGDWEKMHQKVEALRQAGYNLWVVRQPAYLLVPDQLTVDFDIKWKSHLYAFDLDDEFEDKINGGNLWTNPTPILNYVKQRVSDYKKWMPDIPIMANFNGSHVGPDLKDRYVAMIDAGIDIISSDLYPIAAQQVDDKGKILYPDVIAATINATKLFKQWYPHKPVWTFMECCNQDIGKAGADGWTPPWKFVGSRAPTAQELWQVVNFHKQYGGDGLAWFPQANFGAVNDATPPELAPVLAQIAASLQPTVTPTPPVSPPTKQLVTTVTVYVYSDATAVISSRPAKGKRVTQTIVAKVYNDGSVDVK